MTLLALVAASALAVAGTRLAAAVFALAAVAAAWKGGIAAPAAVWTAAMAAGLVLLRVPPRRLAVPAIGATAALAAGAAGNAAIVAGLWTVGTAAAVLSRPKGEVGERWAFGLLEADLLVALTIAFTAINSGFSAWPAPLRDVGAAVLLVSAAARIPAISGHGSTTVPGLLIVRTQVLVLLTTAVRAASHDVLVGMMMAGAAVFAAGGLASSDGHRDAAQEAGLVAVAAATTGLGYGPAGWVWGAMAAGALIHHLRLIAGRGRLGPLASAILGGGGTGLPMLPVVGALLTASLPHRGFAPAVVVAGLAAGLCGRAWTRPASEAVPDMEGFGPDAGFPEPRLRAAAIVFAAVATGLFAPLLTLPRLVAGDGFPWPSAWMGAGVVALAVAAAAAGPGLAPSRVRDPAGRSITIPGIDRAVRVLDPPAGTAAIVGLLGVLTAVSAGVLIVGWARGFL